MTLKNYLLISGLILAMVFTSCKKDEEPDVTAGPPQIEMNGKTNGNIVEVPQSAASNVNNGQFQSATSSINAVGSYLTMLNSVPENATTSRSTNEAVTYYWTASNGGITTEVWYSVEESGSNYNIEYDIAMTYADYPDMSFARTNLMSGWVSQNGANGHLVINFNVYAGQGDFTLNYTYDWDTNAAGDFHVVAEYNIGANSQLANIIYEATVYAAGNGVVDYSYTDGTNNIIWHYDWNADWTVVNWSYSINGTIESSATWNA